jgi:uncharacterized protein (TIGR04255 family)
MDFRPINQNHAISHVLFALEFQHPFSPSQIAKVDALHEDKFQTKLPRKRQLRAMQFEIVPGAGLGTSKTASEGLAGVVFDTVSPAGKVVQALQVNGNVLSATVTNYERWDITWPQIQDYFALVFPVLMPGGNISVIGMQVLDRFVAREGIPEPDPRTVLNRGTKYIVPNAFESKGFWHSHHGFFRETRFTRPHNMLTNLNVGLGNSKNLKSIRLDISCNSRLMLTAPLAGDGQHTDIQNIIGEGMNILHDENKGMIRDLLSDDARAAINLI